MPEFTYFFFFIFFFGFTTCRKNQLPNKKAVPKQAQLGPLGFHWPPGMAQTPVHRVG